MPVDTFASFVAEQAIAITIGVVAIVAAPVLGPKLTAAARNRTGGDGADVQSTQPDAGGNRAAAISDSIFSAGQSAYGKMIGGMAWYSNQWADLAEEAKSSPVPAQAGQNGTTVAQPMIDLLNIKVASQSPGRVRFRGGQQQFIESSQKALVSVQGINRVEVNPRTDSVLICYDAQRYTSLDSLLATVAAQ